MLRLRPGVCWRTRWRRAYREGKIGSRGVREALGLASRFEVDPFLLRYEIYDLTQKMIRQDIATLEALQEKCAAEIAAEPVVR
jgi:hypothetical protein